MSELPDKAKRRRETLAAAAAVLGALSLVAQGALQLADFFWGEDGPPPGPPPGPPGPPGPPVPGTPAPEGP